LDKNLVFYGLSGSFLISEAENHGLKTASEAFADRTYQANGGLTPRSESYALITDGEQAVSQIWQMISENSVTALSGETVPIKTETICIHGDGEHALEFAKAIHEKLKERGIEICRP
jgi:UPF0271 protein